MAENPMLASMIQEVSPETIAAFFQQASSRFRPGREDRFAELKEDQDLLESLEQLGEIEFEDGQTLVVLAGKITGDQTQRRSRTAQANVTRDIACKQSWGNAGIFIFYDDDGRFRFGLISSTSKGIKREFSSWKRYSYFIDPTESHRTFIERVGGCDFANIDSIQDAFSVEPVTKEFYRAYAEVFFQAENAIAETNGLSKKNPEEKELLRMYTQMLFNRLMFLRFMEKKDWLEWGGEKANYLARLFQAGTPEGQTFFQHRLPISMRLAWRC